jgi:hypothetical protein
MIIKRWNTSLPGDNKWEEQYPKTTSNQIFDAAGTNAIFDTNNRIKIGYLPNEVFDSLSFSSTVEYSDNDLFANKLQTTLNNLGIVVQNADTYRALRGKYFVAASSIEIEEEEGIQTTVLGDIFGGGGTGYNYWAWTFATGDDYTPSRTSSGLLEAGDWIVIQEISGQGSSSNPYTVVFGVVNNTYEIMLGATSLVDGAPGLVPQPLIANELQFLRGNGTWATPTDTTYGIATEETAGLVEIAHAKLTTNPTIETASDTENRYYGVRLNNNNQMIVNVPWVDTNTTYSKATTSTLGLVETAFADLTSNPSLTETTDGARYYGVQLNQNQQMVVNVPWVNTTYATATDSVLGLVKLGYAQANTQAVVGLPAENSKASSRQYGVQINSSGNASVYVPWENTTYTAGVGLGLSSGAFSMTQPHVVSAAEPATTFRKENTLWFDI